MRQLNRAFLRIAATGVRKEKPAYLFDGCKTAHYMQRARKSNSPAQKWTEDRG